MIGLRRQTAFFPARSMHGTQSWTDIYSTTTLELVGIKGSLQGRSLTMYPSFRIREVAGPR